MEYREVMTSLKETRSKLVADLKAVDRAIVALDGVSLPAAKKSKDPAFRYKKPRHFRRNKEITCRRCGKKTLAATRLQKFCSNRGKESCYHLWMKEHPGQYSRYSYLTKSEPKKAKPVVLVPGDPLR